MRSFSRHTDTDPSPGGDSPSAEDHTGPLQGLEIAGFGLLFAVFAFLALFVVFHRNLNWDEFHFLSQIYEYDQGRLRQPLQTFHVHLLHWLVWLPLDEANQIVLGRVLMFVFECGALFALYLIAKRMFDIRTALLVVAIYIASTFTIEHGASFRTDPLVLFALMAALAILMITRLQMPELIFAGTLCAVGLLVSIKGVLYLPAFFGAFVWRAHSDGLLFAFRKFAAAAIIFALAYAVLWLSHVSSLEIASTLQTSSSNATAVAGKAVLFSDLFPRKYYIEEWGRGGSLTVVALAFGVVIAVIDLLKNRQTARATAVLLFTVPLASLLFYRNAFPYFFPFILAPVALGAAPLFQRCTKPVIIVAVTFGCILTMIVATPRYLGKEQLAQRETVAAVRAAFPKPVNYIDRAGLIPSFPKTGFFMTSWGMEVAIASGRDVMTDTIRKNQPPLVIVNADSLAYALDPEHVAEPILRLSRLDEKTLRENYVHHWGKIWVAGKLLEANRRQTPFEIIIAGSYTIECDVGDILIDERPTACGSVVQLSEGVHAIAASQPCKVVLRYGNQLAKPAAAPSQRPIFYSL